MLPNDVIECKCGQCGHVFKAQKPIDHKLHVGDSGDAAVVNEVMAGAVAGLVWSDPPYGYEYQSNMRTQTEKFEVLVNDDKILTAWIGVAANVSTGWFLVCTSWKVVSEWIAATAGLGAMSNMIIWDKGGGGMGDLEKTLSTDYEIILAFNRGAAIYGKRIGSVWSIGKDRAAEYEHATQKPVELVWTAIDKFSAPASVVFDPFAGSGTSIIAAHRLGRRCVAFEIEPRYADVCLARAEAESLTCELIGQATGSKIS